MYSGESGNETETLRLGSQMRSGLWWNKYQLLLYYQVRIKRLRKCVITEDLLNRQACRERSVFPPQ